MRELLSIEIDAVRIEQHFSSFKAVSLWPLPATFIMEFFSPPKECVSTKDTQCDSHPCRFPLEKKDPRIFTASEGLTAHMRAVFPPPHIDLPSTVSAIVPRIAI